MAGRQGHNKGSKGHPGFQPTIGKGKNNIPTPQPKTVQPQTDMSQKEPPISLDQAISLKETTTIFIKQPDSIKTIQIPTQPNLSQGIRILNLLTSHTPTEWTLIGGLMVQSHCAEYDVKPTRTTDDIDLAIDVFANRTTLRKITIMLQQLGFSDVTPDAFDHAEQLSYRWACEQLKFDLMVPQKVNAQKIVPTTATGLPSVEMPAIQQAVSRSETIKLEILGETSGYVRRSNLLGAIIVKSVAATKDRRDPERHYKDLVDLGVVAAQHPNLEDLTLDVTAKDKKRILRALNSFPSESLWNAASEPSLAKDALYFIAEK